MANQNFLDNQAREATARAEAASAAREELDPEIPLGKRLQADDLVNKLKSEAEGARFAAAMNRYHPPEITPCDGKAMYLFCCFLPMALFWYLFDIELQWGYDCWLNLGTGKGLLIWLLSFYFLFYLLPPILIGTAIGMIPFFACLAVYKYTGYIGYAIVAAIPLMGITLWYLRYLPSLLGFLYVTLSFIHETIFRLLFFWVPKIRKADFGYKFILINYILIPIIFLFSAAKTDAGFCDTFKEMFRPHKGQIIRYRWKTTVSRTFWGFDVPPEVYGLPREINKGRDMRYDPMMERMLQKKKEIEEEMKKNRKPPKDPALNFD